MSGWVGGFVLLVGAYVLLAGQVSVGEAVAAVPAVCGGFGLAILRRRHATHEVRVTGASFEPAKSLPVALVRDTGLVGRALVRALWRAESGAFVSRAFGAGDEGRVAVAVLAESLAPNGFVVDLKERNAVLHQLAQT